MHYFHIFFSHDLKNDGSLTKYMRKGNHIPSLRLAVNILFLSLSERAIFFAATKCHILTSSAAAPIVFQPLGDLFSDKVQASSEVPPDGERNKKLPAVALIKDPSVQDNNTAPVAAAPDQPAKTLFETYDCLGYTQ
jgi:hypothetical protein